MKKAFYFLAVFFLLASCEDDKISPGNINPSLENTKAIEVTPPATIVLKGKDLDAATEVLLNNRPLTIVSKTESELEVQVPSGAFSGTAVVKFPDPDISLRKYIKVIDANVTTKDLPLSHLMKVDFLGGGNVLKYGGDGIVYRSTDGSTNWQSIYESVHVSPNVPFKAYDASHIWVLLGGAKQMAITQNGGETWKEITTLPDHIINDLFFLSLEKVVVTTIDLNTGSGAIYTTNDGGQKWTKAYESSSAIVSNLKLAYSGGNSMYLASPGGRLMLKTTDGGNTWSESPLLVNLGTPKTGSPISFISEQVGWAYNQPGLKSDEPGIYKTTNGGASWFPVAKPELDYDELISAVRFWSDNVGVAVTTKGGYMQTDDGGVSWKLYYMPGTNPQLLDLDQDNLYFYSDKLLIKAIR
ncbi:WD40/YVTN/BNR-like repeat-containing protein [Pontibacter burrus]|uniref:Photosynthesis system II assembly factor Ycf48/Hcf136-like domain-containing protein n=1 Tax=Pontibacter burrus TaxID=2704466 RepID=A0A6B3LKZ2_9BACT|nr:YCF48-related protein [Pontibacter burrus]NEM96633.1 hypothetical protein [Pontibacter burrus]